MSTWRWREARCHPASAGRPRWEPESTLLPAPGLAVYHTVMEAAEASAPSCLAVAPLPSHLPLRHFTQDLLSLSQLGIWGLRGGRKGNGIEPKGNPTPPSGLGRRHTMGEEAGTRLNLVRVWGHLEGGKERSGVQVPSSAAPSLHSSLETGAGGPKNSPRGAIASRPPW